MIIFLEITTKNSIKLCISGWGHNPGEPFIQCGIQTIDSEKSLSNSILKRCNKVLIHIQFICDSCHTYRLLNYIMFLSACLPFFLLSFLWQNFKYLHVSCPYRGLGKDTCNMLKSQELLTCYWVGKLKINRKHYIQIEIKFKDLQQHLGSLLYAVCTLQHSTLRTNFELKQMQVSWRSC